MSEYNYKQLLADLKSNNWYNTNAYNKAIEALCDYDSEHGGIDIISYDIAEELVKQELDKGGLIRLKFFIGDINLTDDYYYMDGYGNLQNITRDWLIMQLEDVIEADNEE